MDDHRAHFLSIVVDICVGAALGRLTVEFETVGGKRFSGTPGEDEDDWADEINSESTIRLGGHELRVGDITACRVHAPRMAAEPVRSVQTQ
jgi:hypothetical protein